MNLENIPVGLKLQTTFSGHSDVIFRIAWSPDGKFLASPSRDKTIKVWSLDTGELYRNLQGHTLRVNSVAWSRNSNQLVSCGSDGIIALWDFKKDSPQINQIKKFTSNSDVIPVFDIAWDSETGLFAAACKDGNVRLWSSKHNGTVRNLAGINAYINCVVWSPNGKFLAAASGDKKVRLWEVTEDGEPRLLWEVDAQYSPVNSIAWSPDGKLLASIGKQRLKIWDVLGQKKLKEIKVQPDEQGFIKSVAFSSDGKLLAAKCQSSQIEKNNAVKILDSDTLQIIATLPEPTTPKAANGIAFHPSAPILATQGENDTVIRLWDLTNLDPPKIDSTNNPNKKRKALVVGIDKYKEIKSELKTCAADAQAVAQFLREKGWEIQGGKELLNEEATLDKLRDSLDQLFQPHEGETPESALFYFSGLGAGVEGYSWGVAVPSDRKGDLVTYDSGVNTTISLREELYKLLLKSPVNQQIVWLDSDYSGCFIGIAQQSSSISPLSSRCFIASSQKDELAVDQPAHEGKGNGVFSTALLDILKSKSASPDELVTNQTLEELNGIALPSGQHPVVFNSGQPIALTEKLSDKDGELPSIPDIEERAVSEMQEKLKLLGYYSDAIDGSIGPITVQAVKQFQHKHKLVQDGIPGPGTLRMLEQEFQEFLKKPENGFIEDRTNSDGLINLSETPIPPWIFGMYDPGDWRNLVEQADKKAWIMFHQVVGHDRTDQGGNPEFAEWAQAGHGVLARLVNAPFSNENKGDGSIPLPENYEGFAQRCANFVQNSPGCKIWFIGEEMNISWHWPSRGGNSQPISPGDYARCFKLVRDAIQQVQPNAWVIPSGLNPLKHPDTKHENALQWFGEMLNLVDELDGFDLHSYFPDRNSYSYKEFIDKIPENKRNLPIFLTEATPPDIWLETANGWMQETYKNIDEWNSSPSNQQIYAVLPYRWQGISPDGKPDPWNLIDLSSHRKDFSEVIKQDYRWKSISQPSSISEDSATKLATLLQMLKDKDSNVRKKAAEELGPFRNEEAVDALLQALKDKDSSVRWNATAGLGRIRNEKAIDPLITALSDEDSNVRGNAAWALGEIANENSINSLNQSALHDENVNVRRSAEDALKKIKAAIPKQNGIGTESSSNQLNISRQEVVRVQTLLTQAGHSVAIDGDYGEKTQAAVKQVQEELGVHTDQVLTPSFIQLLKLQPPPPDDTIKIEIVADTVSLDFNGNEYSNPNLLAQCAEALSVAEQKADWAKYGELLFEAIINDMRNEQGAGSSVRTGYRNAREQISSQRLRMELDLDPNRMRLHEYKWEYLKDPRDEVPVAVYEQSPLYRCPRNDNKQDPVEAKPLKILVVICNPSTLKDPAQSKAFSPAVSSTSDNPVEQLVKIDVAQEKAVVKTGLQRLQEEGLVEYVFLDESENGPRTTLNNLIAELRENKYHVLHIVAHGFLMGSSFMLVMESVDGRHDCVDAKRFNPPMFPDSLRLVVLASCQTAQTDSDNVIRGLGARLSNLGVPAVVAMQDLVPIPTAQLFTQYFYDHLARSGRIDMAMAATRYDLYRRREGDTGDWGIPVLFMKSKSGQLFEVDRQKACTVDPLRPEVKTYDQLPGRGDPRPQVLASSLETLARQHNLNPEQIALLSSLAASLRPNTAPLAPPQNRPDLQAKIRKDLKMEPIEPRELEKVATLSLPFHVYGQIASALNTGKHIILIGPPGTGKTTIAHDICEYVKYSEKTGDQERQEGWSAGYTSTTATADWTTFDTIGGYVPTPQQTLQFRPGIFLQAIAQGNWLVIDEINRSDIDKSFGELFTVLSGQQVDLPYTINDQSVSILPAKAWETHKHDQPDNYTYVIHPNWRVIGTMNVYDKSSLFNLSFAFMRRFAFIEVDVPDHQIYQNKLLTDRDKGWFANWKQEKRVAEILESLQLKLLDLLRLKDVEDVTLLKDLELTINPLMSCRAIGPAIIKDMVDYIGDRYQPDQPGEDIINCLGEAFLLYLSPQLDGIGQDEILNIHYFVAALFKEKDICSSILNRIELFYPHIRGWQR